MIDPTTLRADAYLNAPAAKVAADPDRPQVHFAPPARWMNDPNGTIRHGGWYHLFYQLNPFGDSWGFMHWGHARSRDLVTWELLPIALAPLVEQGEEHCFSGCIALDRDGTPTLFYTSIGFAGTRPSRQCIARPDDAELRTWSRDLTPAVPGALHEDARDPFIFRWHDRTFLILGDRQRVPLYEAIDGDLTRLVERAPLFTAAPGQVPFCECPNFLPVGDQWLLLLSPYRPVEWTLGGFDGERFTAERFGRLDLHDAFYATNTLTDDEGRTVVLGWVRGFAGGKGWSGCLALPRLIEPDERAGIRQRLHPCVAALRHGEPQRWSGAVHGTQTIAEGLISAAEVEITLTAPACLRICGCELRWDGRWLHLAGSAYDIPVGVLDLHIVVDRTVVEVFADGGLTVVTRVVYPQARDALVQVTTDCDSLSATIHHLSR